MKIFQKNKKYATVSTTTRKEVTEKKGLWIKCQGCNDILYKVDVEENLNKCPNCDHHFKMSACERIDLLIDKDSFVEFDKELRSTDPLTFPGYKEKYEATVEKLSMNDGVVSGTGNLSGRKVSIAAMDFSFIGGSMGSVVGEKITRAIERGVDENLPVIVVATSGGARMHEGILSLMQMAKTSAALERLRGANLPFISIPVNPTTGGVTASFAMLGDVIITEPDALIGFAGARVIEQTINEKLPEGFQRSEFLLESGMVDIISNRSNLKKTVGDVLSNLMD